MADESEAGGVQGMAQAVRNCYRGSRGDGNEKEKGSKDECGWVMS